MSPGSKTESYPAFAHIGLRENPEKNLNQVTCPDRESNPGHLVSRLDALTATPQHLINLSSRNELTTHQSLAICGPQFEKRWEFCPEHTNSGPLARGAASRFRVQGDTKVIEPGEARWSNPKAATISCSCPAAAELADWKDFPEYFGLSETSTNPSTA
ncbi:hypothetical protein ANN_24235 [Periplaneta americana]|uniref:Uncharacterized protein n=1 Tax=Periplaneta americana TaxID=6978 RepID=A0ABQ8S2H8_PERAM|nr:hypothetical protein ANN_24235 [Periplaneta americana]